jgi:hypothetical protein
MRRSPRQNRTGVPPVGFPRRGPQTRNSLPPPKQLQAIPYSLFPIPCSSVHSTAPNASAALIPPNPKLFDTTRRTGISTPSPVT